MEALLGFILLHFIHYTICVTRITQFNIEGIIFVLNTMIFNKVVFSQFKIL